MLTGGDFEAEGEDTELGDEITAGDEGDGGA